MVPSRRAGPSQLHLDELLADGQRGSTSAIRELFVVHRLALQAISTCAVASPMGVAPAAALLDPRIGTAAFDHAVDMRRSIGATSIRTTVRSGPSSGSRTHEMHSSTRHTVDVDAAGTIADCLPMLLWPDLYKQLFEPFFVGEAAGCRYMMMLVVAAIDGTSRQQAAQRLGWLSEGGFHKGWKRLSTVDQASCMQRVHQLADAIDASPPSFQFGGARHLLNSNTALLDAAVAALPDALQARGGRFAAASIQGLLTGGPPDLWARGSPVGGVHPFPPWRSWWSARTAGQRALLTDVAVEQAAALRLGALDRTGLTPRPVAQFLDRPEVTSDGTRMLSSGSDVGRTPHAVARK